MSGINEITLAIEANEWKRFQRAVLNTQNLNDIDDYGFAPVIYAVLFGRTHMVKELIRRGASVNYADADGDTPVFMAAREGYTDLARVLVELKADAHKANNDGETPLHGAAGRGHMAIVKYLVEECHTEINTKDKYGGTPISDAKQHVNKDIANYLEQQLIVQQTANEVRV